MAYYQNIPTRAQMLECIREAQVEAKAWLAHKAALIEAQRTIEHAEQRRQMETKRRQMARLTAPAADAVRMTLHKGDWRTPPSWTVTGRGASATFSDHKEAEREARTRATGRP